MPYGKCQLVALGWYHMVVTIDDVDNQNDDENPTCYAVSIPKRDVNDRFIFKKFFKNSRDFHFKIIIRVVFSGTA
jgi:hypothetical protein